MLSPTPTGALDAVRLRVLVVEDSLTIRKYLVRVLEAEGIEVVGEAEDGLRAAALCQQLRPAVVTMDMILPGLSGLAATEQIMAYSPTPILIVSASTNRGEVFHTYEALAAGAVDVLDKVKAGETSAEWEQRFLAAVRMAARIKVITHPRARLSQWKSQNAPPVEQPATGASQAFSQNGLKPGAGALSISSPSPAGRKLAVSEARFGATPTFGHDSQVGRIDLIAIGASTGGPAAIAGILRSLSSGFPIPILIVLHISEMFAFALAEWLNTLSPIPARYAVDGEPLPLPGKPQVVLAPAGRHLTVEAGLLRLSDAVERNSCRPSIDVLFESLAREPKLRSLLCLLTGMGKDGAAGMLAGRRAGLQTVAQDEASSIIFGMPAEAIRMGAARRILSLGDISGLIASLGQTGADESTGLLGGRAASWS